MLEKIVKPCFFCTTIFISGTLWAQFEPTRPAIKTIQVTVDDGSGGIQTQTYGEEERRQLHEAWVRGTEPPTNFQTQKGAPNPATGTTPIPLNNGATLPTETQTLGIKTADGRTLPFGISGKTTNISGGKSDTGKTIDSTIDPHSALRNLTRNEENFSTQKYDTSARNGGSLSNLSGEENISIPWSQWSAQFASPWGRKTNEAIDFSDTFDSGTYDKTTFENTKPNRPISPWSKEFGQYRNQNKRRETSMNSDIQSREVINFKERMLAQNKAAQTVSMQGINKYQFRRNHPDTPGQIPVGTPGGAIQNDSFSGGEK